MSLDVLRDPQVAILPVFPLLSVAAVFLPSMFARIYPQFSLQPRFWTIGALMLCDRSSLKSSFSFLHPAAALAKVAEGNGLSCFTALPLGDGYEYRAENSSV
jgi:hypothetical protein